MADCASSPSCILSRLHRTTKPSAVCVTTNASITILKRDHLYSQRKHLFLNPSNDSSLVHGPVSKSVHVRHPFLKKTSLRHCCFPELAASESLAPFSWVPVADQVLLMASMVCAYMAGALPNQRIFPPLRNKTADPEAIDAGSTSYGRSNEGCTHSKDLWDQVEAKLTDAFAAVQTNKALDSRTPACEYKSSPLCLFAIDEDPRLRLIWACLRHLKKEVNTILSSYEIVDRDIWLATALDVMKRSTEPVCVKWLNDELKMSLEVDQKLMSKVSGRLKGDDTIVRVISRLGKAELYADLLFFLRFGSLRSDCCYTSKIFTEHAVNMLEDMIIMFADGIANLYLELISVDSSLSSEMNGMATMFCSFSTRALQKLRNEVALNQWVKQNFESVVSMYEDRFELNVITRQLVDPIKRQNSGGTWWEKLTSSSTKQDQSVYIQIHRFSMPVKRTKELRSLAGWRYYYSLVLEFSDIMMPLLRAVTGKVRDAVSFFLVCLIGRSLGLIYTGIRQSFGWR